MGFEGLKRICRHQEQIELVLLALDTKADREKLKKYTAQDNITVHWGDLTCYEDVLSCIKGADLVLHVGAFVSPAADYHPEKAMKINYGSTSNLLKAIRETGQSETTAFVYIGTVAETGDRLPPIHWGRVGDPIKPSVFDYYAVSKIAAERIVIESGLKRFVSLRQTGIMGPGMSRIQDAIMFHNGFDNVLEYVTDRDSGRLLEHLALYYAKGTLPETFWGHIYNIGGGKECRIDTYSLYKTMYAKIGITRLEYILDPRWQATRNFHGQYYLDSDKLEDYLHFRHDTLDYFYNIYIKNLGMTGVLSRFLCSLPGGQKLMGTMIRNSFRKLARTEHGTLHFLENNKEEYIEAFFGSKEAWEKIPDSMRKVKHYRNWDNVQLLDHGYDETKAPEMLHLKDMVKAAAFRGGTCDSLSMEEGDWKTPLSFTCAFGHAFSASPRLVLEGGHWCPDCERKSWNYGERAKRDHFFAQVWYPLHGKGENREVPKTVSELLM